MYGEGQCWKPQLKPPEVESKISISIAMGCIRSPK